MSQSRGGTRRRWPDLTADRADIFHEVMDKHYDKATKNEQTEGRGDYLIFMRGFYHYDLSFSEYE